MFSDKKKQKILEKVYKKNPLICLTSYTAPIAKIADKFADIILVGDSVGPVLYGLESTKKVSLQMMIQHGRAVVENTENALIAIDMPFGSYEENKMKAYKNAKKIISETGADAVKLEGGEQISKTVKYLTQKGILVIGHIGMLPQSCEGKYKVYGKSNLQKKQIINDLKLLLRPFFDVWVFFPLVELSKFWFDVAVLLLILAERFNLWAFPFALMPL